MCFSGAVDSPGVDIHQLVLNAVINTGQRLRKSTLHAAVVPQILAPIEPAALK